MYILYLYFIFVCHILFYCIFRRYVSQRHLNSNLSCNFYTLNMAIKLYYYYSVCAACDCDRVGSATLQCDRHTGACECLEGVGGHKCDRCARGTTGFMPNCVPCGECFDDWDRIISELSSKFTFKRMYF